MQSRRGCLSRPPAGPDRGRRDQQQQQWRKRACCWRLTQTACCCSSSGRTVTAVPPSGPIALRAHRQPAEAIRGMRLCVSPRTCLHAFVRASVTVLGVGLLSLQLFNLPLPLSAWNLSSLSHARTHARARNKQVAHTPYLMNEFDASFRTPERVEAMLALRRTAVIRSPLLVPYFCLAMCESRSSGSPEPRLTYIGSQPKLALAAVDAAGHRKEASRVCLLHCVRAMRSCMCVRACVLTNSQHKQNHSPCVCCVVPAGHMGHSHAQAGATAQQQGRDRVPRRQEPTAALHHPGWLGCFSFFGKKTAHDTFATMHIKMLHSREMHMACNQCSGKRQGETNTLLSPCLFS